MFTKYDQFLRNVEMHLLDYPDQYQDSNVAEVARKQFQEHYLDPLGDSVKYVRLERKSQVHIGSMCLCCFLEMHRPTGNCGDLIEQTAVALNEDIIALMLLAVQKNNLTLSVKVALK